MASGVYIHRLYIHIQTLLLTGKEDDGGKDMSTVIKETALDLYKHVPKINVML